MTAQRHPANTDGPDWDKVWASIQQSGVPALHSEAANDDEPVGDHEREPSRFGLGSVVVVALLVLVAVVGAIQ